MKKYDVVVGLGFASPPESETNKKIALRAALLGHSLGLPVFCEALLPRLHPNIEIAEAEKDRTLALRKDGFSTLRFARKLAVEAKKRGWKNVLVVAAPDHAPRVLRDIRKLGLDAEADEYFRKKGDRLYDKKSEQKWTRSPWRFLPREWILMHLPWSIYCRIAG